MGQALFAVSGEGIAVGAQRDGEAAICPDENSISGSYPSSRRLPARSVPVSEFDSKL